MKKFQKNPDLPGAELLPGLEQTRNRGRNTTWSQDEKDKLTEALRKFGKDRKDWNQIANCIESKNAAQTRSFYYDQMRKFKMKDPQLPGGDTLHFLSEFESNRRR